MAPPDREVQLQRELNRLRLEQQAIDAQIAASSAGSLERAQAELDLGQVRIQRAQTLTQLAQERGSLTAARVAALRSATQQLRHEEQALSNIVNL